MVVVPFKASPDFLWSLSKPPEQVCCAFWVFLPLQNSKPDKSWSSRERERAGASFVPADLKQRSRPPPGDVDFPEKTDRQVVALPCETRGCSCLVAEEQAHFWLGVEGCAFKAWGLKQLRQITRTFWIESVGWSILSTGVLSCSRCHNLCWVQWRSSTECLDSWRRSLLRFCQPGTRRLQLSLYNRVRLMLVTRRSHMNSQSLTTWISELRLDRLAASRYWKSFLFRQGAMTSVPTISKAPTFMQSAFVWAQEREKGQVWGSKKKQIETFLDFSFHFWPV